MNSFYHVFALQQHPRVRSLRGLMLKATKRLRNRGQIRCSRAHAHTSLPFPLSGKHAFVDSMPPIPSTARCTALTLAFARSVGLTFSITLTIRRTLTLPQEDPNNAPHVGGNTWAGGTGGSDTAGLGGRGGPYRLDKGHTVHQISDEVTEAKGKGRRLGDTGSKGGV